MSERRIGDGVLDHLRGLVASDEPGEAFSEGGPTVAAGAPMSRFANRFTIERRLGIGGMGAVYLAVDDTNRAKVALKIVHAGHPSLDARFDKEARALESVVDPAVLRHVAHGTTADGARFLATELLLGRTLREHLAEVGRLDARKTITLGRAIAAGLGAVHDKGLVHRDLTPSNVLLCEDGTLRVIDFGLTHFSGSSHTLTGPGGVVGTFGYMSPEQAKGEALIDARADVFSLGCILAHCLIGRPPFGVGVAHMLALLMSDTDPLDRLPDSVPPALRIVLGRMLSHERDGRPANGHAVDAALASLEVENEPAAPTHSDDPTPEGGDDGSTEWATLALKPGGRKTAIDPSASVDVSGSFSTISRAPKPEPVPVEVVWWSPLAASRVQRVADLAELLGEQPGELPASHVVHRVLRNGTLARHSELLPLLFGSFEVDGGHPEIVVIEGDLALPFDERARLAALASLAELARQASPAVDAAASGAHVVLSSEPPAIEAVRAATTQLLQALSAAGVEPRVGRTLLESRAHARLTLLGGPHIRGLMTPRDSQTSIPIYLPEEALPKLPLFTSFRARALVEIRARQDEAEAAAISLSALAIGRVLSSTDG